MLYKTCRYRNWIVHWFFCTGESDFLFFTLDRIGADERLIERMKEQIRHKNSGFTFSANRESIVYISTQTSKEEFHDTIVHEIRHVVDDICSYYDIDLDSEEAAYMQGGLVKCVSNILCEEICIK